MPDAMSGFMPYTMSYFVPNAMGYFMPDAMSYFIPSAMRGFAPDAKSHEDRLTALSPFTALRLYRLLPHYRRDGSFLKQ